MSFEIRRAVIADAEALADLLRSLSYFHRLQAEPAEQVRARARELMQLALADASHSVYVAEDGGGEILGYAAVHWLPYLFLRGPEGYVSELFVAESARGLGIGTRLLEAVKAEARSRGCSRLSLLNMRDRESYQRQFYARDGWFERPDAANFIFDMSNG